MTTAQITFDTLDASTLDGGSNTGDLVIEILSTNDGVFPSQMERGDGANVADR